ncbi:MAG: Ig-like domain-containing protein, partial [Saccharospirillaceae bacterium]|nr:Ig-like domain-containing protein [Saccharospirillaceae bacterium]
MADTDGDGITDGDEVTNGTDPLNPDTVPPSVIAISPASASTDIAESTVIDATFNELLSVRSINLDAFQVLDLATNNPVFGNLTLLDDGATIRFEPAELLNDFTEYQISITGIQDTAGNPMAAAFTSQFTTGNTIDTEGPFTEHISPIDDATDVPTNSTINILLNERINVGSFSTEHVYLQDQTTDLRVTSLIELDQNRQKITITPDAALAVGHDFYVQLSSFEDLFGNQTLTRRYHFTTAFEADTTAPGVVAMSVAEGEVSVPTNARLEVQFNEPVSGLSLQGLNVLQGGNLLPVQSRTLSDGNRRVRLHLADPLLANTAYTLRAEGVEDISGNRQAVAVSHDFTTGDGAELATLQIIEQSPFDNQTDVPLNTRIGLTFNQHLHPLDVSASLRLTDSFDGSPVAFPLDIERVRGDTLVVTPQSALHANDGYTISGTVTSLSGQTLRVSYAFRMAGDVADEPLAISDWSVPDNYTAMPINGALAIEFSAPLDVASCPIADNVTISDGNSDVAFTWSVSEAQSRTRLVLTPTEPLQANTSYSVTISGLCDLAGNAIATAVSQTFTTTDEVDTTSPTLVSVTPEDDATAVSTTSPVVWTFSEPVRSRTSNPLSETVYLYIDDTRNKLPGDLSWSADHTVLTFTPSLPYPAGTEIHAILGERLLQDVAGNSMQALNGLNFTTAIGDADGTPPLVIQVTPADGAVDIDSSNAVVLTFSEPLDYRTINTDNFGLYANGERITTSVSRSYDNRTVTLSTTSVPANSVISVVATADVQDLSGNALADFISVYSTAVLGETTRPSINRTYPGNNASQVQVDKNIVLFVSEPVNAATVTSETLLVSQDGLLVEGSLEVSGDNQIITFTPIQPWNVGSTIQVFAQSGIEDTQGNPLTDHQSTFRTVEDDATTTLLV